MNVKMLLQNIIRKILITTQILICPLALTAQDTIVMPSIGNGGFYNTCYGIIYDNGKDTDYDNYSHSTVTISPLGVQNVNLYFEEFQTEIFFDSLTIYDGPGITFPVLGIYSGNSLQGQTISSTANAITLEFRSDDIQTGTGFKAWINCTLGNEELNPEEINIFPNPAQTHLTLTSMDPEKINSITIIDSKGCIIVQGIPQTNIDISFLSPGLYFLIIQTSDQKKLYKKWIKE